MPTLEDLTPKQLIALYTLVFNREYNPKHPDDYNNAGGFFAHWNSYSEAEQNELIEAAE